MTETLPLAGTYTIDVPGTNKTLTSITRECFNADMKPSYMKIARMFLDDIADENLLAAITANRLLALGEILEDAETADDILEYAQEVLPLQIPSVWSGSDYYAERTGMNIDDNDSIFAWAYADNGSQFLGYMLLQLLSIAERRDCVAKGIPYEGPTIIDSADCFERAELLRDEHGLNLCD